LAISSTKKLRKTLKKPQNPGVGWQPSATGLKRWQAGAPLLSHGFIKEIKG